MAKSLFSCLWTETKSRSINSRKKNEANIQPYLDRTILVNNPHIFNKAFIIRLSRKFCLRDTAGSLERAKWPHLTRSGSQSQREIWVILPARGASHIIKSKISAVPHCASLILVPRKNLRFSVFSFADATTQQGCIVKVYYRPRDRPYIK